MHMRRAGHVVTPPLNCGVRRHITHMRKISAKRIVQVACAALITGGVIGWFGGILLPVSVFLSVIVFSSVILVLGTAIVASSWVGGIGDGDVYGNSHLFVYPIVVAVALTLGVWFVFVFAGRI
jgi:hypothetical protein